MLEFVEKKPEDELMKLVEVCYCVVILVCGF